MLEEALDRRESGDLGLLVVLLLISWVHFNKWLDLIGSQFLYL